MNVSLYVINLNKDKNRRQRAVAVLCLILVVLSLVVFLCMKKVAVAMTDVPICGMPEHTHNERCLAERISVYDDEDQTLADDDIDPTDWACGLEEHVHTADCYPDLKADVESEQDWEASLPELTGHPAADIVRIAATQIGYPESKRNVEVDDLGSGVYEFRGYTRYGAFAGEPYCGNWSAAFVSFCMHYAGMDEKEAPRDIDCDKMMRLWQDAGIFLAARDHDAQPGDIVFIDRSADGEADSVAIVTAADAMNIEVVEGDSNKKVEKITIALSEGIILGYGAPPEGGVPVNDSEHTSGSSWINKDRRASNTKKSRGRSSGAKSAASDVALDPYITAVTGSGTTKVDENRYLTVLELSFTIDTATALDVTGSGHKFVFDLPDEIELLDAIIDGGPFYAYKVDSNPLELAFTYDFISNGDGTYRVEVIYDEDFVESALYSGSDYIDNLLDFRCYINVEDGSGSSGLDIEFTVDQTLVIPPEDINENYDIATQKSGSLTSDGKLRYEVTVSSVNGTPSDIDLTDSFVYSGDGTVSAPTSVSVVLHHADGTVETSQIPAQGHITSSAQNQYDIALTLPQLVEHEYYTLVYEYAVTGLTDEDASVSAYNTVDVNSSDGHDTSTDSADYFIYNQQRPKIGKEGIPYDEYVQWVISVNDRGGDIAGKTVYDDSFADARNELINGTNGIVVQRGWAMATPGVDYEFVYDGDGQIVGVRFLPADGSTPNTNTYHITYYTYPDVAYGETAAEHNEAEFDGDTASYDVIVTGGDIDKSADGEESLGNDLYGMDWTVSVTVPVGGILAGTTFTDTLSPSGHYLTQAQYNALVTAIQTAWGSTSVTVAPVYTGDYITGYTLTVGTAGDGYLLDDGFSDEISWQYRTTADMSGKTTGTFVNTFTDGEKTLTVNNTVSPNVKKLNARKINDWQTQFTEDPGNLAFDYEDEDKTFVWIAQVTPTPGVQQYHVTDVLPEGVELIGVKVFPSPLTAYNYGINDYPDFNLTIAADGTISGEIGQLWFSRTIVSGTLTTTADGRQAVDITLTRNSANSDLFDNHPSFNVIYYCQLSEDVWPENGTVHLTLNNTVSVQADNAEYGEADNQINIDATNMQDVVGKTSVWNSSTHLITYTVDINPTADNLLTSSGGTLDPEWLQFRDVLTYTARQGTGVGEAVLNLNSVTLEIEEDGVWTELTNVQWTARTETDPTDPNKMDAIIEMRIPDEAHLRLTYSYHVNSSMSDGITLENSAMVEGHAEEAGDDQTHIEVEDFQTYGESNYKEFRLIKIDEENGRPLSGAVFTVYTWDSVNDEWTATSKTYTTDTDGKIIIRVTDEYADGTRVYSKDTAYCIMETAAPFGYMLPDNPRPFYFWFSENETAPLDGPDDFMLTAADVSTSSHRIEAENQCQPDYVTDTGVTGVDPLLSFGALLVSGVAASLVILAVVKKKKSYGEAE